MDETANPGTTLFLSRADVERVLSPRLCIAAVEDAFRQQGEGRIPPSGLLGMHAAEGGFHVKAAFLGADRPYFAAKLNANFPRNPSRHGLPTIQGVVVLFDASNGAPLAIMDSIAITALRTAAASAVAAKHLARADCETLTICGCGAQAAPHLNALLEVRKPRRVLAYDVEGARAIAFARGFAKISVEPVDELAAAARASDIVVTCTPSAKYFLTREMVRPGAFVAAVGADSEHKQEIEPALMAEAKVVTDLTDQASAIGDLHHAIAAGAMTREKVHAELGEIVAGRKPGREHAGEIIVFDSTGTGLQDAAAAVAAYRRAAKDRSGMWVAL